MQIPNRSWQHNVCIMSGGHGFSLWWAQGGFQDFLFKMPFWPHLFTGNKAFWLKFCETPNFLILIPLFPICEFSIGAYLELSGVSRPLRTWKWVQGLRLGSVWKEGDVSNTILFECCPSSLDRLTDLNKRCSTCCKLVSCFGPRNPSLKFCPY